MLQRPAKKWGSVWPGVGGQEQGFGWFACFKIRDISAYLGADRKGQMKSKTWMMEKREESDIWRENGI